MLSLVPRLHGLVGSAASRTVEQLRSLGVDPSGRSVRIAVVVESPSAPGRWLTATNLVDMLLRLDPLVGEVIIDAAGMEEGGLASELATRIPLVATSVDRGADLTVVVGASRS